METLPLLAIAAAIWYVEASSRGRRNGGDLLVAPNCGQLMRRYAPETIGLLVCLCLGAALRLRGDRTEVAPEDQAAWDEIQNAWPILTTADSLFALQAYVRLILLLSAILQPQSNRSTVETAPLAGWPAKFYFLAGVVRVGLLLVSPDHGLEGPLSGPTYFAFEVAALPLLFKLAFGKTLQDDSRRSSPLATLGKFLASTLGIAVAAVLASQHRMPLAQDGFLNGLFTFASLLETLAAIACLLCTTCGGSASRGSFASLAHVILPIQQSLSTYFFLTAFDMALEKASMGHPLTLLQSAGALELGLLLFSGIAHLALAEAQDVSVGVTSRPLAATIF